VLSGMSNMQQTSDNVSYMRDFAPLDKDEQAIIAKVVNIIHESIAIPCTDCHYCTEGCPEHIAIPEYFALYNNQRQFPLNLDARRGDYANLTKEHGRASDCIACRECESHCPQHIEICEQMKEVALTFDK
jgi:predicted aldo/keto reductase-like oxidoreductase